MELLELRDMACTLFDQDWDLVYQRSPSALIRQYCRINPRRVVIRIHSQISAINRLHPAETEARRIWRNEVGAGAGPGRRSGSSARQWLAAIETLVATELAGYRMYALKEFARSFHFDRGELSLVDERHRSEAMEQIATGLKDSEGKLVDLYSELSFLLELGTLREDVAAEVWVEECKAAFDPRLYNIEIDTFLRFVMRSLQKCLPAWYDEDSW